MGTINTQSFHVLKQYELNIPVPVVVLNGKAQGITLGGSLGAQIVSKEGSVSFFGGNNTFINAGGFDAAAALVSIFPLPQKKKKNHKTKRKRIANGYFFFFFVSSSIERDSPIFPRKR